MRARFADKVVLVIGGNRGIGFAAAEAFVREGACVVITGRDPKTLAAAAERLGPDTLAIRSDVTELDEHGELMSRIKEEHGRIDVLFVSAGGGSPMPIERVTERDWDDVMALNLKSTYFVVQKAIALMRKGGSIVLTSSLAASRVLPGLSVYAASKAGVSSLGRSLAAELVGRGIRVNVVSPGPIDTPLFARTPVMPPGVLEAMRERISGSNPMRRWGAPEEVAELVLFLASDDASFITGTDTLIDGGAGSF